MCINSENYFMTMMCYENYARVKITLFDGMQDVGEAKFNCTYDSYLYRVLKNLKDDTLETEKILNHVYKMMEKKYRIIKHNMRIDKINS